MPGLDRFVDRNTARAIDRVAQELQSPFALMGPPLEVYLANAGDTAAVEHGLGAVPDGMLVLMQLGGTVQAASITKWTSTFAYLVATDDATRARVMFVKCRQEVGRG